MPSAAPLAAALYRASGLVLWPISDVAGFCILVRYERKTGQPYLRDTTQPKPAKCRYKES
jgi:hypothetical protein